MKKLIILFFITNLGLCQDLTHVKKLDTIYLFICKKKDEYLRFEKPDDKNPLSKTGRSFLPRIENKTF